MLARPFPWADSVAGYLGDASVDLAKVDAHLDAVTAMVKAYTRGRGFAVDGTPADDLAQVIITSTARLVSNPAHNRDETVGPFSIRHGVFDGWTLPELAVLHTYRSRAA